VRWTPEQLVEYLNKRVAHKTEETHEPDIGPESVLQGKIEIWANDHGYPILSFRQSKKAKGFLPPGWPDITLVLKSRVLFLELKSKTGRLSEDQEKLKIMFLYLKANWHEVRSYKHFIEIVQEGETQ